MDNNIHIGFDYGGKDHSAYFMFYLDEACEISKEEFERLSVGDFRNSQPPVQKPDKYRIIKKHYGDLY